MTRRGRDGSQNGPTAPDGQPDEVDWQAQMRGLWNRQAEKDPRLRRIEPPAFALGQLVATPGALEAVPESELRAALGRHMRKDWGDVCAEDAAANELALREGTRLLSSYRTADGTKFWIITEADRSATTVLLPEEY